MRICTNFVNTIHKAYSIVLNTTNMFQQMLVVAFSDNYVMVYKKGRLQQRKFTSYRDYGRPDAVLTDFFSRIYLIKVSHLPR